MMSPEILIVVALSLAILPVCLGAMTCYLKVSIVLNALKHSFGAQSFPGSFAVFAIALGITGVVMKPVADKIFENFEAANITLSGVPAFRTLLSNFEPLRHFLVKNSGEKEITFFANRLNQPKDSWQVAMASFLVTELSEAFELALLIYLPFLAVDIIVASLLVTAGMFMVSPMIVSLPIKIGLLVIADPWLKLFDVFAASY